MRYRILIIDDELDVARPDGGKTRREFYKELQTSFDLRYLEEPGELSRVLDSDTFHAVILDFVLREWDTDSNGILAVLKARNQPPLPVALISGYWVPNFDKLRQALSNHPEVRALFAWEELEQPRRRSHVVMWLQAVIAGAHDQITNLVGKDESIRILQLSDLQFGSELPVAFAAETELIAQRVRNHWRASPHLIAMNGDIAERGMPSEYSAALQWFKGLANKLDEQWSSDRFLLVPGNHDVCWPLGWSGRIDLGTSKLLDDSGPAYQELCDFAFAPFRYFAGQLIGKQSWSEGTHYWTSGRLRHLGLILFGYNSCEERDLRSSPTRRLVDKTLAAMFQELRGHLTENPDALVVGLMHHPVYANDPSEVIINPQTLLVNTSISPANIVLLTGHVHADGAQVHQFGEGSILQIAASTLTKPERNRPSDASRGFNLIELCRQGGRIQEIKVTCFRFSQDGLSLNHQGSYLRSKSGLISTKGSD